MIAHRSLTLAATALLHSTIVLAQISSGPTKAQRIVLDNPEVISLQLAPITRRRSQGIYAKEPGPFKPASKIAFEIVATNSSMTTLDVFGCDTFNQNRLRLLRSGQEISYRNGLDDLLRNKEKEMDCLHLVISHLEPNQPKSIETINLSDWYDSLGPGHYQLSTRHRFVNGGKWVDSSLVTFDIETTDDNAISKYRQTHEHEILSEFIDLLSLPNVAADRENVRRNAAFILEMMKRRGLAAQLLEAKDANVPPAVYAEWKTPGAMQTIIFYAHYDGQPTDPKQWTKSLPWQPTLFSAAYENGGTSLPVPAKNEAINPEWRLYARSASDDKAGVMAILTGFDALRTSHIAPTVNIKFFFEGEEEAGSPHLGDLIAQHQDLLQADAWIICDGPVHQSGRKEVVFGARGDTNVDVTVYGAKRPLHSGHYGNWAPNPAMTLARLLASMKDENGRVTVANWYDDVEPLGDAERQAIAAAPSYDDELRAQLGLARTEGPGKSLMEMIMAPSLNINGMSSGDVGALARNVIPTTASAVLDLRLVKGNDHRRQVLRLTEHIRKQGFFVIDHDPTEAERKQYALIAKVTQRAGGYNAERTRMDLPISRAVIDAVQSTVLDQIVKLPTSGGSLPLVIITEHLRTVTISVPVANYDNNQHAENENIRLQNLWDGIETFAALMTMKIGRN